MVNTFTDDFKIIEIVLIITIVIGSFFISYLFDQNPLKELHYNTLIVVLAMSGFLAIEGIFLLKSQQSLLVDKLATNIAKKT